MPTSMQKIKKLATIWIVSSIGLISKVSAVTVRTFRDTKDTEHDMSQIDGSRSILDMINVINSYLRFAIWFCCFLFMIRNWYKLITAAWDEKATWAAKKALLWSGIWIIICLLSYTIVNIAVRLFA